MRRAVGSIDLSVFPVVASWWVARSFSPVEHASPPDTIAHENTERSDESEDREPEQAEPSCDCQH
jgi:hypothetical protein